MFIDEKRLLLKEYLFWSNFGARCHQMTTEDIQNNHLSAARVLQDVAAEAYKSANTYRDCYQSI